MECFRINEEWWKVKRQAKTVTSEAENVFIFFGRAFILGQVLDQIYDWRTGDYSFPQSS